MKSGRAFANLLTIGLALLPLLYVWHSWEQMPPQVPQHFANGIADGFMPRQQLVELCWVPTLLYGLCTFAPVLQAGQLKWWRSLQQRQLRMVLVSAASVVIVAYLYRVG